jgi:hypothetical protein
MDAAGITAIGVIFTGLVTLFLRNEAVNRRAQEKKDIRDSKQTTALTAAISRMAKATKDGQEKVAKAVEKQALEAEKRNGHLAEIAVENKDSNFKQNQDILNAISNLPIQHIGKQIVDKQTIKK